MSAELSRQPGLEVDNDRLIKELADVRKRVASMEKESIETRDILAVTQTELEAANKSIITQSDLFKTTDDSIVAIKTTVKDLTEQLSAQELDRDERENQLEGLRTELISTAKAVLAPNKESTVEDPSLAVDVIRRDRQVLLNNLAKSNHQCAELSLNLSKEKKTSSTLCLSLSFPQSPATVISYARHSRCLLVPSRSESLNTERNSCPR